jgi:hypothetical protein
MKNRTIILSIMLIFMVPALSDAQVGNILKNRINKAINKKVEEKIDTAIDRSVKDAQKAAEQEAEQNQGQEAEQAQGQGKGINLGGLMGGKVTSKYNESYSFNNRIYMQMEIYDKKDVSKMDYFIYFSDADPNGGFESKMLVTSDDGNQVTVASSFVFDGVNKSFLIMTDMGAMKMGIISQVPDETAGQTQAAGDVSKATITKTGNTKVIAGYKCDEYLYKDNESKDYGKLWVTKDLKLKADKRTFSKAGLPSFYGNPELEGGAVLAMESYNEKNELEMKSETKEINLNFQHTISTAGYKFSQMNFNQAGQKK